MEFQFKDFLGDVEAEKRYLKTSSIALLQVIIICCSVISCCRYIRELYKSYTQIISTTTPSTVVKVTAKPLNTAKPSNTARPPLSVTPPLTR